jgi:ABC-type sulfate/molybdate transport systems ATPase subunit
VLLLDEPLAALDAHTKAAVRGELGELLHEFDLPTLLVTHDYEDAASLADQVGVIIDGRLRQFGPPQELVANPADVFVASFTGANVIHGVAHRVDGALTEIRLESGHTVYSTDEGTGQVGVVVYPWEVSVGRVHSPDSAMNVIEDAVRSIVHVGNRVRVKVGPVTAEVTEPSWEKLGLGVGGPAIVSFKATGTRIVSYA